MIVVPHIARNALAGVTALLLAGGSAVAGGMPPEIEIDANGVPIESDGATVEMRDGALASPPVEATNVAAPPLAAVAAGAVGPVVAGPVVAATPDEEPSPLAPVSGPFATKKDHR